jgi:hypothetical protein
MDGIRAAFLARQGSRLMVRRRVLYLVLDYPSTSETYIRTEIEAVRHAYDVHVVSMQEGSIPYRNPHPYTVAKGADAALKVVRDWKPDIIHVHWFFANLLGIACRSGKPWTLRTHSFETDWRGAPSAEAKSLVRQIDASACLGVLGFPYVAKDLIGAGLSPSKAIASPPVIDTQSFLNRAPNGNGIMNCGAAVPKHAMGKFVELSKQSKLDRPWRLYPLGHEAPLLKQRNRAMGSPCEVFEPIDPSDMPPEYKKAEFLIMLSNGRGNGIGWPVSVGEAQASGVVPVVPNIRPDMADYLGGGGFLYDKMEDALRFMGEPAPSSMRETGFANAERLDVRRNIHLLTDLWERV